MNEQVPCYDCKNPITERGHKCIECSNFYKKETFFCQRCFGIVHGENFQHESIPVDYTQTTNTQLIQSIMEFERIHLSKTGDVHTVFPFLPKDCKIWATDHFTNIPYSLTNGISFTASIPFICDNLRMNRSFNNIIDRMNIQMCSTDIIITIFKYMSFDIRIWVIEQLSIFQRTIPIYFGFPSPDGSSLNFYFLMQEMLHALLPYFNQKLSFILSFGTQQCKGKTTLLNTILKTNFDCHCKTEFNSEIASTFYHNQLIQLTVGHEYVDDRISNLPKCHVIDLHGNHDWKKMPNFFIKFMNIIIIHMDTSDAGQIDSFPWSTITFNQKAIYLIFIHGNMSDDRMEQEFSSQIGKYFRSNAKNLHIYRAEAVLKTPILRLGILTLLKTADLSNDSLFDVSEQFIKERNINLSTNIDTLVKSRQLLNEFHQMLNGLPKDDLDLHLFPLSQLKRLSERKFLSTTEEKLKEELVVKLHTCNFAKPHKLLTKLAELSTNDDNDTELFEKFFLLWNITLWQRNEQKNQQLPISIFQKFETSKESVLREFQGRSQGYKDRNDLLCPFEDSELMRKALLEIYRNSFRHQQYIEIINGTSSITYPQIFQDAFSNDLEDFKNFFTISIIGEQSGGKSFLMNKLFGTRTAEAKLKCTTGILASRVNISGHNKVKNLLILDTEGLLDREKKDEEAPIFDRKIVLEVMARSHITLINIKGNVNKIMQQILEIVLYGFNKLQITNQPKLIFLFRDQNPRTMGNNDQHEHVQSLFLDIKKACKRFKFNIDNTINGFDFHEFPPPFTHLIDDEKVISFFNNSFCQKALLLREKLVDNLSDLTPFNSFNEWLMLTLDNWEQINDNSNLFDYESLIRLTLEKNLEIFCNQIITNANSEMRKIFQGDAYVNARNTLDSMKILDEIQRKLDNFAQTFSDKLLLEELPDEKTRLMRKYNLEIFPEQLFDSTRSRLTSELNCQKDHYYMAAKRQFQQDEFQKKLSDIPKNLCEKIKQIQNVCENAAQFEKLFDNASMTLLNDFTQMLKNDYKQQSNTLKEQLIKSFIQQNQIDAVGVSFFNRYIVESSLIDLIQNVVLDEYDGQQHQPSSILTTIFEQKSQPHGTGLPSTIASYIMHSFKHLGKNSNIRNQQIDGTLVSLKMEEMVEFLKREYAMFRNSSYYKDNLLRVVELANESVRHIRKASQKSKIDDQNTKNIWYTCYGIMLNIFCDQHYDYTSERLRSEFEQEISRTKREVQQNIMDASTAEEHAQLFIQQIWIMIENNEQKQFQNQFEGFFSNWNQYRPSIISENCVNQLFQSTDYQSMFNYIKDPAGYVKQWLRVKFKEQYETQLTKTSEDLRTQLEKEKLKFQRMIFDWYNVVQSSATLQSVRDLVDSLKIFLLSGKYTKNDIKLSESTGGFSFIHSNTIRTIPPTADRSSLLEAMKLTSQKIQVDADGGFQESTKKLINNKTIKNRLFDEFYHKSKGCGIPCPYCRQMCDNDNPKHTQHRCGHHLLWIFSNHQEKGTEKPSLACCTSNSAFTTSIEHPEVKDRFIPFPEHKQRFNPTWNIVNQKTTLQDYLLKAYIALEEDLAKYYKFKGRADMEIRKTFLRATSTVHCYAFLVGIDYENTKNSLHGAPTNDVSCIREQLLNSAIAHKENMHILKNAQATKKNILKQLKIIIDNMDERSTFLFYFSGHGGRKEPHGSYLLTNDNEKLSGAELAEMINKAKTNKIILILDSCFSGGITNAFKFDSVPPKQGIHLLCSSRAAELSYQIGQKGFFTTYLIKGLKGEYSCEITNCRECQKRRRKLQEAPIHKVTSTELTSYLKHAVTDLQNFSYTNIEGSEFDISFIG